VRTTALAAPVGYTPIKASYPGLNL
jgi:hypothetical protein